MKNFSTIHRTENIQRYFKDINNKKFDPIDDDNLMRKMFENREMFKDIIINSHIRLVAVIAKDYDNNEKFMDFNQVGIEGLLEAFDKYDPTENSKFSSYAALWIRAKMSMLCKEFNMVQKSNQGKLGSKVLKFKDKFYKENMREATTEEIKTHLYEQHGIEVLFDDEIFNISVNSINSELDDDALTPETSGEFAVKTATENEFFTNMEKEDLTDSITKMFSVLSEKEKEYITRHIVNGESYKDIAEESKCTAERVRQIVKGGLKKMKNSDFAKTKFACFLK